MRQARAPGEGRGRVHLWLALLLWGLASLQPAAAQTADRFARGVLWKIEANGIASSHVFGTVHVADPRVTNLPAPVREALNAAASFTMEVTLDPANVQLLAGRMFYLDGRNLPQVIGQPLFDKVVVSAAALGLPPQALSLMKPWAVTLLLVMPKQDPAGVLDNVLHGIAREQGKTIHQLESVEEQVGIFENMPEADQILILRHALDQRSRMQESLVRMIDAYVARDLAAVARIADEDAGADTQVRQANERLKRRVLDERNTRMAERMQPQLKAGRAFVAIGALHLYGENGVLALLEQRGYRVSRVY